MTGTTALLFLNLQNAFCHPRGSFAAAGLSAAPADATSVLARCRQLHAAARGRGILSLFTFMQFSPDYADAGLMVHALHPELRAKRALLAGSWDAALCTEGPVPSATDILLTTTRYDPFVQTTLESYLASRGVGHLVIAGMLTNLSVEAAARSAFDRDLHVTVAEDATAAATPEEKSQALATLGRHYARILPTTTPAHRLFQAP